MAYTINKTNGTIFATVQDGTIDNTTSSLVMIGKNYAGWGEALDENFVKLLESHANPTAPTAPHTGQLWFDTSGGILTVYDGAEFKPLAASTTALSEPEQNLVGDMWYDTVNSQLKIYDGTQYIVVGPSFTASGTTGSIIEVMEDVLSVSHTVVKLYVDSEVVAVISKDAAFTPIGADQIPGFDTVIYPGIQIAETLTGQIPHFTGTATNADLLDNLDSTQFLRSDAPDITTGTLGIVNDGGLTVGGSGEGKLTVSLGDVILNNTTTGDLLISSNSTPVITIDGTTQRATVSAPLSGPDIVNRDYVFDNFVELAGDTMTGDLTVPSIIATGSEGLQWESGRSRISHNDGGGNCQIRMGHEYNVSEIFTADASGAARIRCDIDTEQAPLTIQVASDTGVLTGDTVTWGTELQIAHNALTWGGVQVATENYAVTNFVEKSGDTMTGLLTLSADPSTDLQAAPKRYVDRNGGQPGARLYKTINGSGGLLYASIQVEWQAESFDNHGWHSGTDSRLIVPSTINGLAITGATVSVEYSMNCQNFHYFDLQWYDSSAATLHTIHRSNPQANTATVANLLGTDYDGQSGLINVQPGDWFRIWAYPQFPIPIGSITLANSQTWFSIDLHKYW